MPSGEMPNWWDTGGVRIIPPYNFHSRAGVELGTGILLRPAIVESLPPLEPDDRIHVKEKERSDMKRTSQEKLLRKLAVKHAARLTDRINQLKEQVKDSNDRTYKEGTEWNRQVKAQAAEIIAAEKLHTELQTQIENLRTAVAALDEERTTLRSELDKAGRVDSSNQMEIGQLRAELEQAKAKLEDMRF